MDFIDLLWNVNQENRLRKSESELETAHSTLDSVQHQLGRALERLDHANLVTLALWELVSERLGLTTEQLRAKVEEIDLRDGVRDGRHVGTNAKCEGCGREIAPWRQRCMYCGHRRIGAGLGDVVGPSKDTPS